VGKTVNVVFNDKAYTILAIPLIFTPTWAILCGQNYIQTLAWR
jgi:hypothetical protein